MAKSKKVVSKSNKLVWASYCTLVIALVVFKLGLNETQNTIFGHSISPDYGDRLVSILASLSVLLLINLYFTKKDLTWWKLCRLVSIYIAVFLFLFGWKLTATGAGIENIQNDGYSVTGGLMMFASGIYSGYLIGIDRINNGKKK